MQSPTLSQPVVATLKTAIDNFAGSYTSGASPTADAAALGTLNTRLGTLPANASGMFGTVFTGGTVLTAKQVSALESAVNTFAGGYSSGANATADSAALSPEHSLAGAFPNSGTFGQGATTSGSVPTTGPLV